MLAKFVPITLELNLYLIRNIISRHVQDHVVLTTAKQVISRRSWDKNDCEMYKNKKKIKKTRAKRRRAPFFVVKYANL